MKVLDLNNPKPRKAATEKYLKHNFGVKINETASLEALISLKNKIHSNIVEARASGQRIESSSLMSKLVMMQESVDAHISTRLEHANQRIASLKSSNYGSVVEALATYIADCVDLGDTMEEACSAATREYRSSKWRFPDEEIIRDSKEYAFSLLMSPERQSITQDTITTPGDQQMTPAKESFLNAIIRKKSAGIPALALKLAGMAGNEPFNESYNLDPKVSEMKKNKVQELRKILEAEVDQAEVMIAAKGFSQDLQEMIEKLGRLQNESLPPLLDQMSDAYGFEATKKFKDETSASIDAIMSAMSHAREQLNVSVKVMASKACGEVDMDTALDFDLDSYDDVHDHVGDRPEAKVDSEEETDEFGAAENPLNDPLGRELKQESLEEAKLQLLSKMKALQEALAKTKNRKK